MVCAVCTQVRNDAKQGVNFQSLLVMLRREFKRNSLLIKLKSARKQFLLNEEFYVNAYYDAEDDSNGDVCIEVIIYHNFDKDRVWDVTQVNDMLIQVFDAVVHEFKHQRQSKHRNYVIYYEHVDYTHCFQDYLTDPDEIDAYAMSIAIELCRTLGKFRALRYMPKLSKLARMKVRDQYVSPNLLAYISHFGDMSNPLLRTLAKKIYIRLQKVDTDYIFM
jgi:hypothetical protein